MWVLQQLFEDVQTMKPNSSRSQSSEIFVVCLKYTKPNYIDPKLLDPNHVFKEVADPGLKKVNVLHKKYEQSNIRQRSGYDESLGMILRSTKTVSEFFESKEPIQMLTDVNAIEFTDKELCQTVLNHPRTTEEIKICLSDLRLLGKLDFKKILKWRTQVRAWLAAEERKAKIARGESVQDEEADNAPDAPHERLDPSQLSEEAIQEEIANLRDLAMQAERKDKKKDRRLSAKERQRQYLGMTDGGFDVADDMELFTLHDSTTRQQLENMHEVRLEDLDNLPMGEEDDEEEEDVAAATVKVGKGGRRQHAIIEVLEDDMEEELELAYKRFMAGRSARMAQAEAMSKKGKGKKSHYDEAGAEVDSDGDNIAPSAKRARAKLGSDAQLDALRDEDQALMESSLAGKKKLRKNDIHGEDLEAYVSMLTKTGGGKKSQAAKGKDGEKGGAGEEDSASSSGDETSEDDGYFDEPAKKKGTAAAGGRKGAAARGDDSDVMDSDMDEEEGGEEGDAYLGAGYVAKTKPGQMVTRDGFSAAGKAAKWFANPIFGSSMIGEEEAVAADQERERARLAKKRKGKSSAAAAEEEEEEEGGYHNTLDSMPKTDKQARKEQRKKDEDRRERKALKNSNKALDDDDEDCKYTCVLMFSSSILPSILIFLQFVCLPCLVPGDATNDLIKRGVGKNGIVKTLKSTGAGFEIVPAEVESSGVLSGMPARVDSRTYDSDEENYDTHDRTRTLALGTMMLRHSKKKALVDASYNRFAWNDPSNMPSWFLDDEMRHNKPQLPIPNALLEQIKSRFQKTGTKEIKKVAEARMRKRKRATLKLKAAKKAANVMAESNEVSERQKLKVRLCCLITFFLRFTFLSFLFFYRDSCLCAIIFTVSKFFF
jgi:hypothetical protein